MTPALFFRFEACVFCEEAGMQHLIWWLRVAGAAQVGIDLANFVLPHKLRCRENLARVSGRCLSCTGSTSSW
jgi:hypothetical protein